MALLAGPAAAGGETGSELAAAAIEAMGGAEAVAALESLSVTAECSGPRGAYSSGVDWRRGGFTLLRQSDESGQRILLAVGEEAWRLEEGGARAELPEGTAAMVHGHAFHLTVLELDSRFHGHRAAGTGEDGCLRVEMLDAEDRPASFCLDPATRLPTRLSFTPERGGEIGLRLSGWREIDGLMYFNAFDLGQGEERYRWVYSTIRPNEDGSRPTAASGERPLAGAWKPGERISLSFKDADLAEVLRSFARLAGFNLVLDPSVQGSVTVELQDVPWEQALEVILESHGLGVERDGGTWSVRAR